MNNTETKLKRYQWVRGEKTGKVEEIIENKEVDGVVWIYFKSGARIKPSMMNEFMLELVDGQTSIDPLNNPITNSTESYSNNLNFSKKPATAVRQLLEKQAQKNIEKINIELLIPMPNKGIYDVIRDSYDKDEVDTEIIALIADFLNGPEMKDVLQQSAKEIVKNYYNLKIQDNAETL